MFDSLVGAGLLVKKNRAEAVVPPPHWAACFHTEAQVYKEFLNWLSITSTKVLSSYC